MSLVRLWRRHRRLAYRSLRSLVRIRRTARKARRQRSSAELRTARCPVADSTAEEVHSQKVSALTARDTLRRNVALEAVQLGNYYAEDPGEVLEYIRENFDRLLGDEDYLIREDAKLRKANVLTRRYTVDEILAKRHEEDGFDIYADPDELPESDYVSNAAVAAAKDDGSVVASATDDVRDELASSATTVGGTAQTAQLQARLDKAFGQGGADSAAAARADELLALVERCAAAGEVTAAVFCCERLEATCGGAGSDGNPAIVQSLPKAVVDRIFTALKKLLGPRCADRPAALQGPWSQSPRNPRKLLGRCLARVIERRRAITDAAGSTRESAEAVRARRADEVLLRLSAAVAVRLKGSDKVASCTRRAQLTDVVAELLRKAGLTVSGAVSRDVVLGLIRSGAVRQKGRLVQWVCNGTAAAPSSRNGTRSKPVAHPGDAPPTPQLRPAQPVQTHAKAARGPLGMSSADLKLLEEASKLRQERRKQRKQSRTKRKASRKGHGAGAGSADAPLGAVPTLVKKQRGQSSSEM